MFLMNNKIKEENNWLPCKNVICGQLVFNFLVLTKNNEMFFYVIFISPRNRKKYSNCL